MVLDVVEDVAGGVHGEGGPFALEFKHDRPAVVARGVQVHGGMGGDDPETVVFAPERVEADALVQVPAPDALVLGVAQDELLAVGECHAWHVVVVAAARVNLPRLFLYKVKQKNFQKFHKKFHKKISKNFQKNFQKNFTNFP